MSIGVSPKRIQSFLEQVEEAAEDVLTDRQEIVELDKRRNTNREALRQLKINKKFNNGSNNWMCVGNMFVRLPRTNIIDNIEKEQQHLDSEIDELRNGLRKKVYKLNEIEGKEKTRGSGLSALSKDEWSAVKQVVGL